MIRVILYSPSGRERVLADLPHETGRMSFALFCPSCGRIWGRVQRGEGWYTLERWCGEHRANNDITGSFFQRYEWTFSAPEDFMQQAPELLQHEFKVHMAWLEQTVRQQDKETA